MALQMRGESVAFDYGFLAADAVGAIDEYVQKHRVSSSAKEALKRASKFVKTVLSTRNVIKNRGTARLGPTDTQIDVDAYRCTLHMIAGHKTAFGVKTSAELQSLLRAIEKTLDDIATEKPHEQPTEADVSRALRFFTQLSELMLNRLEVLESKKRQLLPIA